MGFSVEGGFFPASWLLGPALGLGALAWTLLVVTFALRNDTMERTSRVAQLYGYTVCLVTVVTILFTVPSLVDNAFRLSRPLYSLDRFPNFEPSLASFDAYKATYERAARINLGGDKAAAPLPNDEDLRRQYEALRAARLEENRFQGQRELVKEVLLLGLAGALFVGHWRWLRRRGDDVAAAA